MSSAHRHLSERQLARSLLAGRWRREGGGAEGVGSAGDAGHANDAALLCPSCAARLAEAARLSEHFQRAVLPRTLPCLHLRAASAGGRLGARLGVRWLAAGRWWAPASVAALAALVLLLRPQLDGAGAGRGPDGGVGALGTAPAGELALKGPRDPFPARLFVRRGPGAERLEDGAVVHPGDTLAFVVEPGRRGYALVVSIDGAQRVSIYSPYQGAASAPIPFSILPVVLEPTIVLDEVLGAERLWVMLSDRPLRTRELTPALARLAAAGPAAVQAASADTLLEALPVRPGEVVAVSWLIHKLAR